MIKVLYVLNGHFNSGGIESFVINHFFKLNSKDIKIDFMVHGNESTDGNNPLVEKIRATGSKVYYVTNRSVSYFKNEKEVKTILSNNKYDIVHTHMDAAGYFILRIAKQKNVKVRVAHSHNTSHLLPNNSIKNKIKYQILEYGRKNITKVASHYMACSKLAGEWLYGEKQIENNNVLIVNNSIDTSRFLYNEDVRQKVRKNLNLKDEIVLGHVGRFEDQKNHEFLIDVFNSVSQQMTNKKFKLLLLGNGSLYKKMKEKASFLTEKDNIIFYGNSGKINEMYQAMDIFLLPSRFEGLPFVGIEAQASGLMCLMSEKVSEDVKLTNNVSFLPINEGTKVWVESIMRICKGYPRRNMYNEISTAGYDINRNAKVLENLYKAMVNNELEV